MGSSLPGAQKNITWEVQRYDGWYNNLQHRSRGSVGACQGWGWQWWVGTGDTLTAGLREKPFPTWAWAQEVVVDH